MDSALGDLAVASPPLRRIYRERSSSTCTTPPPGRWCGAVSRPPSRATSLRRTPRKLTRRLPRCSSGIRRSEPGWLQAQEVRVASEQLRREHAHIEPATVQDAPVLRPLG